MNGDVVAIAALVVVGLIAHLAMGWREGRARAVRRVGVLALVPVTGAALCLWIAWLQQGAFLGGVSAILMMGLQVLSLAALLFGAGSGWLARPLPRRHGLATNALILAMPALGAVLVSLVVR